MRQETVMLDDFAEWEGEVKGVHFRSSLPLPEYVPAEDIEVNVGRLATIARLGRLESIELGLHSEEQEFSHSLTGINHDGSATAGSVKSLVARRARSKLRGGGMYLTSSEVVFPKGHAQIEVNVNHPDLDEVNLREPKPWANLFDKSIRSGIGEAGHKQLTQPAFVRGVAFGVGKSFDLLGGSVVALLAQKPVLLPSYLLLFSAIDALDLEHRIKSRGSDHAERRDYEHSFFKDMPVDRLLAAKALSQRKLVRVSKNSKASQ